MGDAGGAQCGRPLAVPELLEVDVAAARGGEQDRRVDPGRHRVERRELASGQRDHALGPGALAVGCNP
jgi:hypothetical protein